MRARNTMVTNSREAALAEQAGTPMAAANEPALQHLAVRARRALFILPKILSGGELPAGQEGGRQPPSRRLPHAWGQA